MVGELVDLVNTVHLLDEVGVRVVEPPQVGSIDVEGEELVLVYAAVLDLVHRVELSLEDNEVTGTGRVLVKETVFKFLEGINNLEEVAV